MVRIFSTNENKYTVKYFVIKMNRSEFFYAEILVKTVYLDKIKLWWLMLIYNLIVNIQLFIHSFIHTSLKYCCYIMLVAFLCFFGCFFYYLILSNIVFSDFKWLFLFFAFWFLFYDKLNNFFHHQCALNWNHYKYKADINSDSMFCHIIRIVKVNHINELFSHLSPTTGLSWRYYRPHPSGWWDVAV